MRVLGRSSRSLKKPTHADHDDGATDPALANALKLVADGMDADEVAQAIASEAEIRFAFEKIRVELISTAVQMMFTGYPAAVIKRRLLMLLELRSAR